MIKRLNMKDPSVTEHHGSYAIQYNTPAHLFIFFVLCSKIFFLMIVGACIRQSIIRTVQWGFCYGLGRDVKGP